MNMTRFQGGRLWLSLGVFVCLGGVFVWLTVSCSSDVRGAPAFSDVGADHPYAGAIQDLADRGVITGYGNGDFGPAAPVTRQQFAKMIVLALGLAPTYSDFCAFKDVSQSGSDLYPYHFIAVAANNGLTKGYADGSFRPLAHITRLQVLTMVVRAAGLLLAQPTDDWRGLADGSDAYDGEIVRMAEDNGLLTGIGGLATWDIGNSATRGEVAQVLHNLLAKSDCFCTLLGCAASSVSEGMASDITQALTRAINRCPVGSTVTIPAGTYTLSSMVKLRSGVSLQGAGAGQTILTMPAQSEQTWMMYNENLADVTISGLTFRASGYSANVSGLYLPGAKNCGASDLRFEGLVYGMKLGMGNIASGWVVSDIVARDCQEPMFIACVYDSTFSRLDLQAVYLEGANKDHTIYLERECRRLTFSDCTLSGGSGYTLHLYLSGGTSSDLTFINTTVDTTDGRYPLVIGSGFSSIRFTDTTFKAGTSGQVVRFYGGSDLTFDGFTASGGSQLVLVAGKVSNVLLRNGTYTGTNLGTGVKFENVTTGAASTTTTSSTSTTTQLPTTASLTEAASAMASTWTLLLGPRG